MWKFCSSYPTDEIRTDTKYDSDTNCIKHNQMILFDSIKLCIGLFKDYKFQFFYEPKWIYHG